MDDLIRYYNVIMAVGIGIVGTSQLRELFEYSDRRERLHWLSTILLNLTALWGTVESLRAGYPGGARIYFLAVALTWLFVAVAYRPLERLQAWRHGKITPPVTPREDLP